MRTGYVFRNWDRTIHSAPRRFLQPIDEPEVMEIVDEANRRGETVRVVGAGHS